MHSTALINDEGDDYFFLETLGLGFTSVVAGAGTALPCQTVVKRQTFEIITRCGLECEPVRARAQTGLSREAWYQQRVWLYVRPTGVRDHIVSLNNTGCRRD